MPGGKGGNPVDPASKVLACLKVLATGSFQESVADSMNYSQVGKILNFKRFPINFVWHDLM